MPYPARLLALLVLTSLLLAPAAVPPARAEVPDAFEDSLVANVNSPTALAFAPGGRILVTRQPGELRVIQDGALLPDPALTIPASEICTGSEQGLLGVAVDPDFSKSHHIFLYYTFERPTGGCVNRVSRFTLPDNNVVDPSSESPLIFEIPSTATNHNGGDLAFGKDGLLYISVGDGGCDYAGDSGCHGENDAARDQHALLGKILRIEEDGDIPPTNPFQGAGTARCNTTGTTTPGNKCQETFAWGLRNPFRIAFDPNAADTRFFINDVGQNAREEIDEGQAGADYGWSCREGDIANPSQSCSAPDRVDPIFDYAHGEDLPGTSLENCDTITGGAFVPDGLWPDFDGAYLFADYGCGAIVKLTKSGGNWSADEFVTDLGSGSAVHLAFGPHGKSQALYYTSYQDGGQVRRISLIAVCLGKPATKVGGGTIVGTKKRDVIVGSDKADVIRGKGGKDRVCAGGGDDEVLGGSGADQIDAGPGQDILRGGSGRDSLEGGEGDDTLDGDGGRDEFDGGPGTDDCLNRPEETAEDCE